MTDVHLDKQRWADLLAGRIPEADRPAILAHLEAPCEACEQFLAEAAEKGEIDALDGIADDALLAIADKQDEHLDELAFARIDRGIQRRRAQRWIRPLVAVAAVALVAIFVGRLPSEESPSREKGVAPRIDRPIRLEVLRSRDGKLLPLGSRSNVQPGDLLVFEIELARPGCVDLRRAQKGVIESLLDRPLCLSEGKHAIERQGEALGLPITKNDPGELTISASLEGGGLDEVTVVVEWP